MLYKLLLFVLFVFAGTIARAQDEATSKFLDSLKTPPQKAPEVVTETFADSTVAEEDTVESSEDYMPVDTSIVSKLRTFAPDTISRIKRDKGFYYQKWLDSLLRAEEGKVEITRKPPPKIPDLSIFFNIFQVILWLLAGTVLVFVIYKLFLGKSRLFVKNSKNINAVVAVEEEVVSAGQYENLIQKAAAENNFRLAVRYLYLQALYNLSEKRYITLATEKTNYQYLNELRQKSEKTVNHFSPLTYKYEYIWYGEYPVSNNMYTLLRDEFTAFNKEIEAY